jgi:hypothetical protein
MFHTEANLQHNHPVGETEMNAYIAQTLAMKGSGSGDQSINLEASWNTFWSAISGPIAPILSVLSVVGVIIVVAAIIKWAWDRRRGLQGGNSSHIWGALLVGVLLCAPTIVIPKFLFLLDIIANAVISIWNTSAGAGA